MPYRSLFITNPAGLRLKDMQLVVDNGDTFTFPVEDLRAVVIDEPAATLSARLISFLAENGVCLIFCDERHLPCAALTPSGAHCRLAKRLRTQTALSLPRQKRLWQQIAVQKIKNQAACLALNGKSESEKLLAIAGQVKSGDPTNREGYAAAVYFKALFGPDFVRSEENRVNAALNYGYAIFRAYLARTIAVYGLEPAVGIHHCSQLNAFNLADDLIEPFRPAVDLFVAQHQKEWDGFGTAERAELVRLLNAVTEVDGARCSLAHAAETAVQSLVGAMESRETLPLKLPRLQPTAYFDYD